MVDAGEKWKEVVLESSRGDFDMSEFNRQLYAVVAIDLMVFFFVLFDGGLYLVGQFRC